MNKKRNRFFDGLHLLAFFCLAVAQPLLEVLAKNAQFFIARRSPPEDLYSVVIALTLLIPVVLILFRHLLDPVSRKLSGGFHSFVMWILFALLLMLALKKSLPLPAAATIALSVVLAGLALYAYWRYSSAAVFTISLLAPVVVVPLLFLFDSSILQILSAEKPLIPRVEVNSKTPVIVLVLDELPLGSLLNAQMQIDEVCFPNFARLQRQSTWYRNASAVSDLTEKGVAAVVTGLYPDLPRLPTNFDYPQNLFTLLASSYELNVSEIDTKFHPAKTIYHPAVPELYAQRMKSLFLDLSAVYLQILLPEAYAKDFPSLGHAWRDFWQLDAVENISQQGRNGRAAPFLDFIDSLQGPTRPVLYFLHVELPHGPWMLFPSGTEYNYSRWSSPLAREETLRGWGGDEIVAHRAFQRYMIQLVYTERLLGQLLDRLEAQDLYDSSILIVTADHGICFDPKESHRSVTNTNFVDVLSVPLFVKSPFQKQGISDDRNAETVDVLPTIADVLGVNAGWEWDGESLLRPSARKKRNFFSWMNRSGTPFEFPSFFYADSKALKIKLALFGSQINAEDLFRFGPLQELQGLPLGKLAPEKTDRITAEIYNRKRLEKVNPDEGFVPALISGKLHFRDAAPDQSTVILALNGIVRGSVPSFRIDQQTAGFAVLVPELSFHPGKNEVAVLLFEQDHYLQVPAGWIDER